MQPRFFPLTIQAAPWYNARMVAETRFIDTHAHLHLPQFDPDRAAVIDHAHAQGVERIIEIGYDLPSSQQAIALAEAYPQIFAVVGVQPNHLISLPSDWLAQIRSLAQHPKVVAIGEIGFDHYWKKASVESQTSAFVAQLEFARELELPVVIHSRDAHADTLRVLREHARGQPGVMHSFSGDWAFAEACLEVGFWLSFSGPLTFKKAHELHEVAQRVPLERVLCETDCPYLSPHPLRGQRNQPAHVALVSAKLAELRNQDHAEIAATLWANAETFFRFQRD